MTVFDRRQFIQSLLTVSAFAAALKADEAQADGRSPLSAHVITLLIVSVLISYIYILALTLVFVSRLTSSKLVKDGTRSGRPGPSQRINRAVKAGSIRMKGDKLYLDIGRKFAAELEKKRSHNISIPIHGQGQSIELSAQRQNKATSAKVMAAGGKGSKTVGTVYLDAMGLILSIRNAKLGD